jgi:hypothetical protein
MLGILLKERVRIAMGRTVLPFSRVIEGEYEAWKKFRRALPREYQRSFDALFNAARFHVAECSYSSRAVPLEAILMAILLEHQHSLQELSLRVQGLEEKEDGKEKR